MIKAVKAIGGNTDFLTAQAFTFLQDETALSAIISASGEDVFTKVRVAGVKLEDDFFEMEGKSVDKLQLVFDQLLSTLTKQTDSLSVILALWQKNVLYLLSQGNHQAYLKRGDQLINLTSGIVDDQLISGYLQPSDRLLLVSEKTTDQQELVERLFKVEAEGLEDELEMILSQAEKVEPLAAILLSLAEETTPSEEPAEPASREYPLVKILQSSLGKLVKFFPKSRKVKIIAGVSLAIIGIIIIGYAFYSNQQSTTNTRFVTLVISAREKYTQAQTLKDSDPQAAKQAWEQAKQQIDQALNLKPNQMEAKKLKEEIKQNKNTIFKVVELSNLSPFLSLDLLKKDFSTKKMSYSLGKVLLLDENQKTLVAVDLSKKTNQILAGSTKLGQAKLASLNGDLAFVYSEDKGILRVDLQSEKTTTIIKPDPQWGKIASLYAFSANVYLLDPLKNQIWKYVPVKSGFTDKTAYLKGLPAGRQVDLAGGSNLQIDYSVWVLTHSPPAGGSGQEGPEILKFTGGVADNFSVGGLDKPISSIASFFVPEKEDLVYLIDPQNSRLLTLSKNGQYLAQYLNEKFKSASDLVVDDKKLYLLAENTIYTAELK